MEADTCLLWHIIGMSGQFWGSQQLTNRQATLKTGHSLLGVHIESSLSWQLTHVNNMLKIVKPSADCISWSNLREQDSLAPNFFIITQQL